MPPTENLTPAAVLPEAGQLIQVVDYTPSEGEQSCQIAASVDFTRQMEPTTRIRLVVGTRAIPTSVRELIDKTRGRWKVEGLIPAFSKQRMESRQVPLIIQAMDLDNLVIETVTFGEFIYRESGKRYRSLTIFDSDNILNKAVISPKNSSGPSVARIREV